MLHNIANLIDNETCLAKWQIRKKTFQQLNGEKCNRVNTIKQLIFVKVCCQIYNFCAVIIIEQKLLNLINDNVISRLM